MRLGTVVVLAVVGCDVGTTVPSSAATGIGVTVSPSSATLQAGASLPFLATVIGTANVAVTWAVREGAAGGSVDAGGMYQAPASTGVFHVVATSAADASRSGEAVVTVSSWTRLAQLTRIAARPLFWGHKSVGDEIKAGLARLIAANPGSGLQLLNNPTLDGSDTVAGVWGETYIGTNGDPVSKVIAFDADLRAGLGAKLAASGGIAFMKLCFADFGTEAATKIQNAAGAATFFNQTYKPTLLALKRDFPKVRFIHFTAPLCNQFNGPNDVREAYSALVRSDPDLQADGVFDPAYWESMDLAGTRHTANGVPFLLWATSGVPADSIYTTDYCHPNTTTGQDWLAGKLVDFIAALP